MNDERDIKKWVICTTSKTKVVPKYRLEDADAVVMLSGPQCGMKHIQYVSKEKLNGVVSKMEWGCCFLPQVQASSSD